ncbi:MAG TPA: hypothetical protein VGB67_04880 [Fibrella sp.]
MQNGFLNGYGNPIVNTTDLHADAHKHVVLKGAGYRLSVAYLLPGDGMSVAGVAFDIGFSGPKHPVSHPAGQIRLNS